MKPYWETDNGNGKIYCGHVLEVLKELPDESVHCVITSPPYFGLRNYGLEPVIWDGNDPECQHEWGEILGRIQSAGYSDKSTLRGFTSPNTKGRKMAQQDGGLQGQFCSLCGAWMGSLGLEPHPSMFVAHLVEVFRKIRRVLRDDGVIFLNLGDSYYGVGRGESHAKSLTGLQSRQMGYISTKGVYSASVGLKPKDLVGVPWMVALALQTDGWYLRDTIIWAKGISFCPSYSGSVMPESATDRCTRSFEYIFMLTKSRKYFYDQVACRENYAGLGKPRPIGKRGNKDRHDQDSIFKAEDCGGRNLRNVWAINPTPFLDAHFSTFPQALVIPMIKLGTSEKGCCPSCGKPWERMVEESYVKPRGNSTIGGRKGVDKSSNWGDDTPVLTKITKTLGWHLTCDCFDTGATATDDPAYVGPEHIETAKCVVLDPFGGSGTVGLVAEKMGRAWVLIDAKEEYCEMAKKRIDPEARQLKLL